MYLMQNIPEKEGCVFFMMDLTEKTVSQEYPYKGRIINMRVDQILLPNGQPASREVVEHPGGVCIAALTDEDEVLFVRQFRYPYHEVVLEVPAGKRSPGEDPLECGTRELKEETGACADQYLSLGTLYPSPGYCEEVIYLYACRITSSGESCPDDDEFLEVERIPLDKAVEMVLQNQISDAKTQVCILKLALLHSRGKI